jgi:hypothetical protein
MEIAAAVSDSEHEAPVDNRSSAFTPLFSYRGGFAKVSDYFSPDGAPHPPDRDEPLAWDSLGPAPGLSSFLCFTIAQTCLSMAFLPRAVRARISVQRFSAFPDLSSSSFVNRLCHTASWHRTPERHSDPRCITSLILVARSPRKRRAVASTSIR